MRKLKMKMKMKAARIFSNKVHEIKSREFKLSEIDSDTNFNTSKVSKLQHESYQLTQSYRAYYGVSKDKQMVTNEIYCSHVFDQILVISTNQHATTSRNTN